jgi:hypothetical protein
LITKSERDVGRELIAKAQGAAVSVNVFRGVRIEQRDSRSWKKEECAARIVRVLIK